MKVTVNEHPVVQSDDYYPFGLSFNSYQRVTSKQNDYLYNGEELQDELDLNWLDYGARMYDPAIGRWHVVDPLGELAYSWTLYRYGFNNPLRFIDPSGMVEEDPIYNKKGELIGDDGKDEGAIHVVVKNKDAKEIDKKPDGEVTNLTNIDHVTLNGGKNTVEGVVASVNAAASDGLHEEGGHTEAVPTTEDELKSGDSSPNTKTVAWTPGQPRSGTSNASTPPFSGTSDPGPMLLDNWHVHTSGTVTTTDSQGQEIKIRSRRGPSGDDKTFAGMMNRRNVTTLQVDTRGTPRVNFLNRQGTTLSMKLKNFKKLGN
jgi:RHS repeat-associated protein